MSYKDFIRNAVNNDTDSEDKYVESKPANDWDINNSTEHIQPGYNNNDKDYNISMRDVVHGINTSRHKLSGANVWLPDKYGNLIPLPDWLGNDPNNIGGNGDGSGPNGSKHYRVEMLSTQGNIIKDKQFCTTLKAVVYENNKDVTAIKDKKYFKWVRFSGSTERDQIADMEWNLKWVEGAKEIPITHEDVNRNAMFQVQFVTEKEAKIWEEETYNAYMKKINNLK